VEYARGSLLSILLIVTSIGIAGVTAYVYQTAQMTGDQNVQNIATITLKNFALGKIEEGQTLTYTKSEVPSLGSAIAVPTTKANVYLHLSSNLGSQDASYTTYDIVVKYASVPVGSIHAAGDTATTLTISQPDSATINLDVSGSWVFDLELTTSARSVSVDTATTVTITVTAENT
jgi:hypothetical protein